MQYLNPCASIVCCHAFLAWQCAVSEKYIVEETMKNGSVMEMIAFACYLILVLGHRIGVIHQ